MTEHPPEGAVCAGHPDILATWTCGRCGSFMCPHCERRTRPEARPMCPACWELRSRSVTTNQARDSGTKLQTAGLVLGVLSLVPMCLAVQLASLILNIIAWTKAKEPPASYVRWRPQLGLALTLLGMALTLFFMMRNP